MTRVQARLGTWGNFFGTVQNVSFEFTEIYSGGNLVLFFPNGKPELARCDDF